jgi:hypothetical protein
MGPGVTTAGTTTAGFSAGTNVPGTMTITGSAPSISASQVWQNAKNNAQYVNFQTIPNTTAATRSLAANNSYLPAIPTKNILPSAEQIAAQQFTRNSARQVFNQTINGSPFRLPNTPANNAVAALPAAQARISQAAPKALPQSTTAADDFIRPVITRKNNRFANINGAMIQNKMSKFGLEVNTKELAKLQPNLRRDFNNLILNGTDGQIKAITCDPRYEQMFRLV